MVQTAVAGVRVEAWDKDLIFDDMSVARLRTVVAHFELRSPVHFRELFLDRNPDLFFKVFRGNALIKCTDDSVLWTSIRIVRL